MKPKKKKKAKRMPPKIHANYIVKLLKERDMCQQEFADILGISKGFMSLIIRGKKRYMSLPMAVRISRALGCNVEEVFSIKTEFDNLPK